MKTSEPYSSLMQTSQQYFSMIIEITKQMSQISKYCLCIAISLLLLACNNGKKCLSSSNEKLFQKYQVSKEIFSLLQVDHGAWGYDVTLRVCNSVTNDLIEEIGLRGEDYLPKIDSVIGDNVYIHYNFPRKQNENNIEPLEFESVVLGDALVKKRHLKYNYIFTNVNAIVGFPIIRPLVIRV